LKLLKSEKRSQLKVKSIINSEYSSYSNNQFSLNNKDLFNLFNKEVGDDEFLSLLNLFTSEKTNLIGEKTPWHTFFTDRLSSEFKVIAISRKAIPTVASLFKREGFRNVGSVQSCLARWIVTNKLILKLKCTFSSSRLYHVHFEDLINSTEITMKGLASFLNVDYETSMIKPRGQDSSNVFSKNINIDRKVNNRYSDKLTEKQVECILNLAQDLESDLGFDIEDKQHTDSLYFKFITDFEILKHKIGIRVMRSGFYPFGCFKYLFTRSFWRN